MTIVDGKTCAYCPVCGKLVQKNKWLFGSLHVCGGSFLGLAFAVALKKRKARTAMRKALQEIGLPPGTNDDKECLFEECCIRLGSWLLCYLDIYNEDGNKDTCRMFLLDAVGERDCFSYETTGIPEPYALAKWLRGVLDKHNLWEELR